MSDRRSSGAILLALGLLHAVVAAGQAPAPSRGTGGARKPDAARLLANVLHLNDNDVRFRTSQGKTVFVDPMAGPANPVATRQGMTKPDLILITHSHRDHYDVVVLRAYAARHPGLVVAGPADVVTYAKVDGIEVREVRPGEEYTMAGVRFGTVPAYFLDGSHPREKGWVGYVLSLDGASYYVTGDTQALPEVAEVRADVLFPPLFGCGGNVEQALATVAAGKPRVAVPVHSGGEEDVIAAFLSRLPPGVQGAYFKDGRLVVQPRTATK